MKSLEKDSLPTSYSVSYNLSLPILCSRSKLILSSFLLKLFYTNPLSVVALYTINLLHLLYLFWYLFLFSSYFKKSVSGSLTDLI